MSCSVLILTKNEAVNMRPCIESVRFSDDIVVFDSLSTDGTQRVARDLGARVIEHPFENYGAQREAARTQVKFKYPWVLALDADERVEADLAAEIPLALRAADELVAYTIRRKDYFRGRWIRRASLYPTWHLRLFQPEKIRYPARSVHEYPEVDGPIGQLHGHLRHENFSKGVLQWWERHLRYASLEADEILRQPRPGLGTFSRLISRDPIERRRALKSLSYVLPLRPELRHAYMMLVRGAVLDGPAGWEYCRMIAEYQRITDQLVADRRAT